MSTVEADILKFVAPREILSGLVGNPIPVSTAHPEIVDALSFPSPLEYSLFMPNQALIS